MQSVQSGVTCALHFILRALKGGPVRSFRCLLYQNLAVHYEKQIATPSLYSEFSYLFHFQMKLRHF